ncbi:MAG: hypothetical protein HA491_00975 [Candidatus Verstraetearchaeota archaeon]|nr:hypothetical protein [Candidatus Verstraetearchaeota archaeon]
MERRRDTGRGEEPDANHHHPPLHVDLVEVLGAPLAHVHQLFLEPARRGRVGDVEARQLDGFVPLRPDLQLPPPGQPERDVYGLHAHVLEAELYKLVAEVPLGLEVSLATGDSAPERVEVEQPPEDLLLGRHGDGDCQKLSLLIFFGHRHLKT